MPVITTRNAPWEGLHDHACGWWISLEQEHLTRTLLETTSLSVDILQDMGVRGRAWMERDFGWSGISERMLDVYLWVRGDGPRPSCVLI